MDAVTEKLRQDFTRVQLLAALAGVTLTHVAERSDGADQPDRVDWRRLHPEVAAQAAWSWVRSNLDLPAAATWWLTRGDTVQARSLALYPPQLRRLEQRRDVMSGAAVALGFQVEQAPNAWLQSVKRRELHERTLDERLFTSALTYLNELRKLM